MTNFIGSLVYFDTIFITDGVSLACGGGASVIVSNPADAIAIQGQSWGLKPSLPQKRADGPMV